MVHTGVNKNLSNNAIIENYRTVINEMTEYHKFLSEVNLGILAGYIFFLIIKLYYPGERAIQIFAIFARCYCLKVMS